MPERIPVKGDRDYDPARRPASPLSRTQAERLTEKIRKGVEQVWTLLGEAHEKNAWAALGYASWDQYVRAEFGLSRGQSYRLIDQAQVIGELETAANLKPGALAGEVSARAAADLKPHLEAVAEEVRTRTEDVKPRERPGVVAEVMAEHRAPPVVAPDPPPPPPVVRPAAPERIPAPTTPSALEVILGGLVECAPVGAREIPADLWTRFDRWVDQAKALRNQQGNRSPVAPRRPEPEEVSPSNCKHPIGRRLGDRCGVCGGPVKGAR